MGLGTGLDNFILNWTFRKIKTANRKVPGDTAPINQN